MFLLVPLVASALQLPKSLTALRASSLEIGDGVSELWTPPSMSSMDTYDGARIGPPPDLASLLLHNRIVYLGMPLVPAVTELIVAELLYLNYESASQPVTLYINSPGTVNSEGRPVGFETEAFAIADTMKYIKPPVYTVCVGQAFGAAAMLLAMGHKGERMCLPNASIMLQQPKSRARGQATDIAIKAREVVANRKITCELLARACGKTVDEVTQDASRTKYLQPEEAVEYGLIDKVIRPSSTSVQTRTNQRPAFSDIM